MTKDECVQIADILTRRSNEIATFHSSYKSKDDHYGSVEMALSREINRLRDLADKVVKDNCQS